MLNTFIITPSWIMRNKKEYLSGLGTFKQLGFRVTNENFPTKLPSDIHKCFQLHSAYKNKNIDIIIAQRGGYSSLKILPYVDFDLIKKNPKIIAGFSDLSTLLNSVYEKTGQVTLHAPMIVNFDKASEFTKKSFLNAIKGFPETNLFKGASTTVYRNGRCEGTLKGGNLVTLTSMIGTPWETQTDNSIVFLEDVDEKLHEIDRYLTQWILCGKFKKVRGLVLGDFRNVTNKEVFKILNSQIKIKFPVIHCPFIGHVKNKITLPVGAKVKLDSYKRTLEVL